MDAQLSASGGESFLGQGASLSGRRWLWREAPARAGQAIAQRLAVPDLLAPYVPGLVSRSGHLRQDMIDQRLAARAYTREHGEDPPTVREWTWPF